MDPSESRDAPPRTTSGAAFAAWDPSRRDAVMRWSLIVLWLFNLEDYVLTQAALRAGAIESNPVIAYFLERGPGPALAFKLGIVTVGSLLLWRLRRHPGAFAASLGLALAYVLVTIFHIALSLS